MKITWYGHSAFRIDNGDTTVLIDPFFTGNPSFEGLEISDAAKGLTHIVLTHGHGDHVGDTVDLAKDSGATVVANYDLCMWLARKGVEKYQPGNTGGTIGLDGFSVTLVNALHSSAQLSEDGVSHSLGSANGVVLHFDNAPTVYHMGDTDIFSDMALIEELHRPKIGLVPIGDRVTMGGAVAALACRRYFNFDTVIPCHYGSFEFLDQNAKTFCSAMEKDADKVKVMVVEGTAEF